MREEREEAKLLRTFVLMSDPVPLHNDVLDAGKPIDLYLCPCEELLRVPVRVCEFCHIGVCSASCMKKHRQSCKWHKTATFDPSPFMVKVGLGIR